MGLQAVLGRLQAGPDRVLPRHRARAPAVRLPVAVHAVLPRAALQDAGSPMLMFFLLTVAFNEQYLSDVPVFFANPHLRRYLSFALSICMQRLADAGSQKSSKRFFLKKS